MLFAELASVFRRNGIWEDPRNIRVIFCGHWNESPQKHWTSQKTTPPKIKGWNLKYHPVWKGTSSFKIPFWGSSSYCSFFGSVYPIFGWFGEAVGSQISKCFGRFLRGVGLWSYGFLWHPREGGSVGFLECAKISAKFTGLHVVIGFLGRSKNAYIYINTYTLYIHIHKHIHIFETGKIPRSSSTLFFIPSTGVNFEAFRVECRSRKVGMDVDSGGGMRTHGPHRFGGGVQTSRNKYMKMIENRVNFSIFSMIFVSEWAL